MRETTALGAAIAAGFAAGVWKDFDELKEVNTKGETTFEPKMGDKEAAKMTKKWEKAVEMCRGWLEEEEAEAKEEALEKKEAEKEKEKL
jgi:glycerol kinase